MSKPNENCLAGLRCPACGSYGPLVIRAAVSLLVSDDGAELDDFASLEWDSGDDCRCPGCDREGAVGDFLSEN